MLLLAASLALHAGSASVLVVEHDRLSPAEQVLAITAQGLANQKSLRVWMRTGGIGALLEPRVGASVATPWEVVDSIRPRVRGVIVYRLGTPSLNVATSLCGPLNAVALDESLLAEAAKHRLTVLRDVRGQNEQDLLAAEPSLFARGIAVEQVLDKPSHLRDLAVARHAFTFDSPTSAWRTQVARQLGPNAKVYGWGRDEFTWIADLARGGAVGVPADWSLNLSALQHMKVPIRRPKYAKIPKPKTPHRTIAFVISDGDNIQWLGGNFALDRGFWASPHRGKIPISWEVAPILADDAPAILGYLYKTATKNDDFITGPGLPSYTFPHEQPNMPQLASLAETLLKRSDLQVVSILNDNAGSPSETVPILDLKQVTGVIYKDYSPYNRRKGELLRHKGKICICYRFLLWEGLTGIDDLVKQVQGMHEDPTNVDSYALINVHAWSFGKMGGPMEATHQVIQKLGQSARVVTASQLVEEVTKLAR
ncbi:MAG: hypothetical protein ACOYON_01310 [Fimbriimonas sp.]